MGNISSQTCSTCESNNAQKNQEFAQNHFAVMCFHYAA
jgi:hypothetical protein